MAAGTVPDSALGKACRRKAGVMSISAGRNGPDDYGNRAHARTDAFNNIITAPAAEGVADIFMDALGDCVDRSWRRWWSSQFCKGIFKLVPIIIASR